MNGTPCEDIPFRAKESITSVGGEALYDIDREGQCGHGMFDCMRQAHRDGKRPIPSLPLITSVTALRANAVSLLKQALVTNVPFIHLYGHAGKLYLPSQLLSGCSF